MPPKPPGASKPFTTCQEDAAEVAKLPHKPSPDASDPRGAGKPDQVLAKLRGWYPDAALPTMGNAVVPYIYGRCAFHDMGTAIATATSADHRIYLLGWGVDPVTVMLEAAGGSPAVRLRDLLQKTKAQIRGVFWDNPDVANDPKMNPAGGNNVPITDFINGLPNGLAILDRKLPFLRYGGIPVLPAGSAHHQKLLVVYGALGLIAFTGGMDVNGSRVGDDPYHDVHFRVTGPAAAVLLRVFRERWLDHSDTHRLDAAKFAMPRARVEADFALVATGQAPAPVPSVTLGRGSRAPGSYAVAIGRTYADLGRMNRSQERYGFAPKGERTAWELVKKAVGQARHYIYIEDQYLVSRRLKALLVDRLRDPQFKFLLILMEKSTTFEHYKELLKREKKKDKDGNVMKDEYGRDIEEVSFPNEFPYLVGARNEWRTDFAAADPSGRKWRMFSLKASPDDERKKWCGPYVHAKTCLVDDEFAVIGTVNVNDRGYTFDSEIAAGITDDLMGRMGGHRFARDLRVNLWHKHLAVPRARLESWEEGLKVWRKPPPEAMVVDASALEYSELLGSKGLVRDDPGANRLWTESIDPDADLLP
ncbi:hypothetical protein ETD83_00950 [Actinomadura soli]|uniref:PLD phosphodiesterase domain-containing protein n=1 Tax=Actinomadura soli TaxID=2508997 RepID=A0A5C4JKW6_9ACTN|nr:phospholipase D-like domain-containing protein [Actinomadura soli]TMR07345.1 hypothetical protein ETD83_00950 [Actinomadura soli]